MTFSTRGDNIPGKPLCDLRSQSMTTTIPPTKYRHTTRPNQLHRQSQEEWKALRITWLDQFDLEVSEEKNYTVWRWLAEPTPNSPHGHVDQHGVRRRVAWWERRTPDEPHPTTPGLWPSDE